MAEEFVRAPTTPCPVHLRLADGSTLDGVVWLLPDSARSSGLTSVEALLDGNREFFAVGVGGTSYLVARCAVMTAELDVDGPGAGDVAAGASMDVVTVRLDSGEEVSGVLRAVGRAGAERMSDIFNAAGRYLAFGVGDRLVLVAKSRIVRASF